MVNTDNCPCIDCKTRTPVCHGICPSYKAWRKAMDKQNASARAAKISYSESHLMKLHWKNLRRKC